MKAPDTSTAVHRPFGTATARGARALAIHAVNLNLWIGAAAALLSAATFELRGARPDVAVIGFVGSATALVYGTPFVRLWLSSPMRRPNVRQAWILAHLGRFLASFVVFAATASVCFFELDSHERLRLCLPIAATLAYVLPVLPWRGRMRSMRDVPLLKSLWIAWLWWCLTYDLPVASLREVAPPPWGVEHGFQRFALVFVLALVFDARDREDDLRQGLITIPTVFGRRAALALGVAAMILCGWFTRDLFALNGGVAFLFGGSAAIGVCIGALRRPRWYYYTGVVDGVMIAQPLLLIALRRIA